MKKMSIEYKAYLKFLGATIEFVYPGTPKEQRASAIEFYQKMMFHFLLSGSQFKQVNEITPIVVWVWGGNAFAGADILSNEFTNEQLIHEWGIEYQLHKLSGFAIEETPLELFSPISNDNVFVLASCRQIMDELLNVKS